MVFVQRPPEFNAIGGTLEESQSEKTQRDCSADGIGKLLESGRVFNDGSSEAVLRESGYFLLGYDVFGWLLNAAFNFLCPALKQSRGGPCSILVRSHE